MSVLLLNASMQPLNVISERRLVILLSKERVAFLNESAELEAWAAMQRRRFPASVMVVRLLRTIHVPRRMLRPNRRNLLLRDDTTCQYCGTVSPAGELTVDHVVPVSRGGASNTWENQVIACRRCNGRKANRLADEVGMRLRRRPQPLRDEYAHVLFLRHPELKAAYEAVVTVASFA